MTCPDVDHDSYRTSGTLHRPTVVDHCCDAWNRLTEQPWRFMSIGESDAYDSGERTMARGSVGDGSG